LESILAHTDFSDGELIGIDAGSNDGLLQTMETKPFDILISLPKEKGITDITKTPNYFQRGIDLSSGEFIIKMDGDIFVYENWLNPLINILNSRVGVSSYFFCGRGLLPDVLSNGLSGEDKKYGEQSYISTDIINGGIWAMDRQTLYDVGGYYVESDWGGALDSCMSKKFLSLNKELAYLYPRKAKHCGGAMTTKQTTGNILPDSYYDNSMSIHYPDELKWFLDNEKK